MMMSNKDFDYEDKIWGINEVDLHPSYLGATRLKYVLRALERIKKGKVLEVGCGGGTFARAIKKYRPELEVLGCDISKEALKAAREVGQGVEYVLGKAEKLPFNDRSFEVVVSFDVWEHLDKPQSAFREAARVLKPRGLMHFFVPLEGNKWSLYQLLPKKIYEYKTGNTGHIQVYTKEKLTRMLIEVGLKIKKNNYSGGYFYQLVDLAYFTWLSLRGRNARVSVEGYLRFCKGGFLDRILGLMKVIFGWLTYIENELFSWLPLGGIHISAVREKDK